MNFNSECESAIIALKTLTDAEGKGNLSSNITFIYMKSKSCKTQISVCTHLFIVLSTGTLYFATL